MTDADYGSEPFLIAPCWNGALGNGIHLGEYARRVKKGINDEKFIAAL